MLQAIQESVDDFLNLSLNLPTDSLLAYHRMASSVHTLCSVVREAEDMQQPRSEILSVLEPARLLHKQSAFIERLQKWPRGYVGDFETIEYICDNSVKAVPNTPAFYLEHQALRTVASQQHRNKIQWQAKYICETSLLHNEARILSIACGSSRDIRSIQEVLKKVNTHFFLNDADSEALQFSFNYLGDLTPEITLIPGNVFKLIRDFSALQPFHLIVAGGLFDYLTDRQIEWLVPKLVALLRSNGSLRFTNIAPGNPDRVWMEYLADWHIIERSEADVQRLLNNTKESNDVEINIERDSTGLTLLIELRRK